LTGHVAIGVVGALCAAAVVFGVGMASATYRLADVGAWLSSTVRGELVHVNGLSGKVDGKVTLSGSVGHPMEVVQRNGVVLLLDKTTGVLSRIDPAHLNVVQGAGYRGAAGMDVVSGPGTAYALDQRVGNVQRLDPMTLATVGAPLKFTAPLGAGAIDASTVLWVPLPANGQAAPVRNGQAARPVGIGSPGDDLALTIAAGIPVLIDFTSGQCMIFGPNGTRATVRLPSVVTQASKGTVLVPASTDGQLVPLLAGKSLVVLNAGSGSLSTVSLTLPGHRFAAPQVLGERIYVPDQDSGSMLVYDTSTNRMAASVPVTGRAGPLEAFVKDGLLWVNDPDSAKAVVVDGTGGYKPIRKYTGDVPGNANHALPIPKAPARGTVPGRQRQSSHNPGRKSRAPVDLPVKAPTLPPPDPPVVPAPPGVPINVRAAAQPDGTIRVDFQPGSGGPVIGFKLIAPAGLNATPPQIGPDGPLFSFTVSGGTCGPDQYSFAVGALYQNGDQVSEVDSPLSSPTLSCTEPDAPSGVTGSATDQGLQLSWQAPPDAASKNVTYGIDVSGPKPFSTSDYTGTSISIPQIWKNGSYNLSVTSINLAGSKTATATQTLTGPSRQYTGLDSNFNTPDGPIEYMGNTPDEKAPGPVERPWPGRAITVDCQIIGGDYHSFDGKVLGDLWDYVHFGADQGYAPDIDISTPTHSNPSILNGVPLWECA
jgi:YVTN family beta-propeller protein